MVYKPTPISNSPISSSLNSLHTHISLHTHTNPPPPQKKRQQKPQIQHQHHHDKPTFYSQREEPSQFRWWPSFIPSTVQRRPSSSSLFQTSQSSCSFKTTNNLSGYIVLKSSSNAPTVTLCQRSFTGCQYEELWFSASFLLFFQTFYYWSCIW